MANGMKKTGLVLMLVLLIPVRVLAGEITVAVDANGQYGIEEITAEVQKAKGITVKTVVASSSELIDRIKDGATFDVFLSTEVDSLAALLRDGFVHRGPKVYAYGSLVLWAVKDIDLSSGMGLLTEPEIRKIAVVNPRTEPYGKQAVKAIRTYRLYRDLRDKLVYGDTVSQVNQLVVAGTADIGLTAKALVLSPDLKGEGKWVDMDPKAYDRISHGAVILMYAVKHNIKDAESFCQYIFSPEAGEILGKYGYSLP